MKTTIKSAILFSAIALLSTGAFAASTSKTDTLTNDVTARVNYFSNTADVDVNIDNATEGDAIVNILDAAGNVLLNDKFAIATSKVKKSYLLDGLADGNYTIEVSAGGVIAKHTVTLNSDVSAETAFAF
jgi:ribose 5-phosphate isomerase